MKTISIQGITFKQFRDTKYYCDENGNIYSEYSRKILKPLLRGQKEKQYYYIDINFGKGQKHYPIHRIVYEVWIGEIQDGKQVLHKDDNQLNNNINNLYLGNQKENIKDCENNNHKVGNTWTLTIYDKAIKQTLTFCPASDFIEYSGHSCRNGNVKRMFTRNWFKDRYEIIDYYLCKNLDIKKGVTTMGDECNPVGQDLSLLEARNTTNSGEEIV
jgi:hypothetical protein